MLPHIKNSQAGNNRQDPNYKNMFEMYFTIPEALMSRFGNDVAVLTEQVQKVEGLGTLDKGPEKVTQKFMGTTRTYLASKLDDTSHEITVTIALNLRKGTDNYIYKLFRAWNNLCYNKATGETTLKEEYCADWFKIVIANRGGDIYRQILFHGELHLLPSRELYRGQHPIPILSHVLQAAFYRHKHQIRPQLSIQDSFLLNL